MKQRRCLIPGSDYYEWQKTLTGKQPSHIHLPEYAPFAFAGRWSKWNGPEEPVRSCTILTTEPNGHLVGVHNRMSAILPREAAKVWLHPALTVSEALAPLRSCPEGELGATRFIGVSGGMAYEGPACIVPLVM